MYAVPVATPTARTPCMVLVVVRMVYMVLCRIARQFARHSPLPTRRTLQHFLLDPTLPQTSLLAIGQTTFSAETTTLPSLRLDPAMLTSTVHMDGLLEEMPARTALLIFAVVIANCTLLSVRHQAYWRLELLEWPPAFLLAKPLLLPVPPLRLLEEPTGTE